MDNTDKFYSHENASMTAALAALKHTIHSPEADIDGLADPIITIIDRYGLPHTYQVILFWCDLIDIYHDSDSDPIADAHLSQQEEAQLLEPYFTCVLQAARTIYRNILNPIPPISHQERQARAKVSDAAFVTVARHGPEALMTLIALVAYTAHRTVRAAGPEAIDRVSALAHERITLFNLAAEEEVF